jgi:hypothetical protein
MPLISIIIIQFFFPLEIGKNVALPQIGLLKSLKIQRSLSWGCIEGENNNIEIY